MTDTEINKKLEIINEMMAELRAELERIASNGDWIAKRTVESLGNEIHKLLIESKRY